MKKIHGTFVFVLITIVWPALSFAQTASALQAYNFILHNSQDPAEYVVQKFSKYDLVMLGEDHAIKQDLDFVANLIPKLYQSNVYNLCMEFGASEMQPRLDSLINAPDYNENIARDMMYYYNVGWAYKEYTDIYRTAWAFNRTLPANARKFRIVNLSYQYNWSAFGLPKTPENMSKVFCKGTPDDFRARLIEKEIVNKHEKALIFVGSVHAFTRFKMVTLKMNADDFRDYDDGFLGNRLIRKHPGTVFNILLHCALYNKPGEPSVMESPGNGMIESLMELQNNKPAGFDLINSPVGELRDNSYFSVGYTNLTMGQLFDGYIFLVPLRQMIGCTIDTLFFKDRPWDQTKKQMPDPDWHTAKTQEEYWSQIKLFVDLGKRYKEATESKAFHLSSGKIVRLENFPSAYVQPRNVDVWLPENYNPSRRYAVLYMHDGQMLFDSTHTWNHTEWKMDEHVSALISKKKIKDCIIVGIWNNGAYRFAEYFPQKPLDYLPAGYRDTLTNLHFQGKPLADNYLAFLTKELKPFIDAAFSTAPDQSNTFIAGSSMGGLISVYAVCEYPEVFGGAACLSTHWIGEFKSRETIPNAFNQYLSAHLPSPVNHRIYFDHGTAGLDSLYGPKQDKVDKIMTAKRYTFGKNWLTREYTGETHSETSWAKRIDVPLLFLLKK